MSRTIEEHSEEMHTELHRTESNTHCIGLNSQCPHVYLTPNLSKPSHAKANLVMPMHGSYQLGNVLPKDKLFSSHND